MPMSLWGPGYNVMAWIRFNNLQDLYVESWVLMVDPIIERSALISRLLHIWICKFVVLLWGVTQSEDAVHLGGTFVRSVCWPLLLISWCAIHLCCGGLPQHRLRARPTVHGSKPLKQSQNNPRPHPWSALLRHFVTALGGWHLPSPVFILFAHVTVPFFFWHRLD